MASITSRRPRPSAAAPSGSSSPGTSLASLRWAREEAQRASLPVVVEVITERVTNIAMGPEIDRIADFEEVVDRSRCGEHERAAAA